MYIAVGGFCFPRRFFFFFRQQQNFVNHFWVGRYGRKNLVLGSFERFSKSPVHYEAKFSIFGLVGVLGGPEVGPKRSTKILIHLHLDIGYNMADTDLRFFHYLGH